MIRIAAGLCSLFITFNCVAAVFQTVDEEGNVTFSDRSDGASHEKKLAQPPVLKIKKNPAGEKSKEPVKGLGKIKVEEKKPKPYKQFSIVSPKHDKAIRNNIGNVELILKVSPDLQTKFGHKFKVTLDGKIQNTTWTSASILLNNIDRGTHTIRASIVDKQGKVLKQSSSISFHLHRFSRLFR